MTTAGKRVLPADVYDFLELSALAEGGISAGKFTRFDGRDLAHCGCIHGHAGQALADDLELPCAEADEAREALLAAGIDFPENDEAVRAINCRKGIPFADDPVTWREFVTELNVVRGPHPTSTRGTETTDPS